MTLAVPSDLHGAVYMYARTRAAVLCYVLLCRSSESHV